MENDISCHDFAKTGWIEFYFPVISMYRKTTSENARWRKGTALLALTASLPTKYLVGWMTDLGMSQLFFAVVSIIDYQFLGWSLKRSTFNLLSSHYWLRHVRELGLFWRILTSSGAVLGLDVLFWSFPESSIVLLCEVHQCLGISQVHASGKYIHSNWWSTWIFLLKWSRPPCRWKN